jgi:hypothetical protein
MFPRQSECQNLSILGTNGFTFRLIQETNPSQIKLFLYIITFKATYFDFIESSSGLLETDPMYQYL